MASRAFIIGVTVAIIVIFAIVFCIFETVLYFKVHKCIQYKDVCKLRHTRFQPMPMGKSMTLMPVTYYTAVDCSEHHDTVVRECVKRL